MTIAALTIVGVGVVLVQRTSWRTSDRFLDERPEQPRQEARDKTLSSTRPVDESADRFTAAFERGIAAYNADDAETAVDAFEEAVRLEPDNAEARINLGLVYMRLQRPEDAIRELEAGARLERERTQKHSARRERRKHPDTIKE
jgi:Flp pilus assembly protein TadD